MFDLVVGASAIYTGSRNCSACWSKLGRLRTERTIGNLSVWVTTRSVTLARSISCPVPCRRDRRIPLYRCVLAYEVTDAELVQVCRSMVIYC